MESDGVLGQLPTSCGCLNCRGRTNHTTGVTTTPTVNVVTRPPFEEARFFANLSDAHLEHLLNLPLAKRGGQFQIYGTASTPTAGN